MSIILFILECLALFVFVISVMSVIKAAYKIYKVYKLKEGKVFEREIDEASFEVAIAYVITYLIVM